MTVNLLAIYTNVFDPQVSMYPRARDDQIYANATCDEWGSGDRRPSRDQPSSASTR
jgi:hypothetical protein